MRNTLFVCAAALLPVLACALSPGTRIAREQAAERGTREGGELALGELNCFACHAASDAMRDRVQPASAPHLAGVGARVSPGYLRRFLREPDTTKPGTRMPDMLADMPERERGETVERLVHFLASLGGPFDETPTAASAPEIEEGRQLFHEVGCAQCHAPMQLPWELDFTFWELADEVLVDTYGHPAPVPVPVPVPENIDINPRRNVLLGDLTTKTNLFALTTFLLDPLAVRPSGRMPSLGLTADEARNISAYLLRDQGGGSESFPGLAYEYFESEFTEDVADFDALTPVRLGATPGLVGLPEHRDDQFGFRLKGFVRVDTPGEYSFFTTSDDGSRLSIDGEVVVRNDGMHGMVEATGAVQLEAGLHAIEVTHFEAGGDEGLEVRWEGPGIEKSELPPERLSYVAAALRPLSGDPGVPLDPVLAEAGGVLFGELGCVACHETGVETLDRLPKPLAPPFDELHEGRSLGCIDPDPKRGLPHYDLAGGAVDAAGLRGLVRDPSPLATEQPPAARVTQLLERFRCDLCHSRAGEGGPRKDRRAYFHIKGDFDLGDEGRIPPALDEPGSKLRREWIERVLFDGMGARPYMATRMPRFGEANVHELPALFAEVDGKPLDGHEPEFTVEAVEDGQRLVGTRGLGCINCHTFAGHDALGIPAVDLANLHERLQPDWFRRLLVDPIALNMNTRMPEFWVDGRSPVEDVCDGDPARQIDALWTYFSLGHAMPLPEGLVVPDAEFELTPTDRPLTCGVFMRDVSPRTVVVGYPIQAHFAFDVQNSRLAKVWRGGFLNARGTWEGRAGVLESPAGQDVFDLPPGPAFARLDSAAADWPNGPGHAPLRALGRRFDSERRPSFRYALGDITIEELAFPELVQGGPIMHRKFRIVSPVAVEDLWFRGAEGRRRVTLASNGEGSFSAEFEEVVRW